MTNKTEGLEVVAYRMKGSDGNWHLYYQNVGWKAEPELFDPLVTLASAQAAVEDERDEASTMLNQIELALNGVTYIGSYADGVRALRQQLAEWKDECVAWRNRGAAQLAEKQESVANIIRCEFDDECEFCNSPEGGSFTRLIHNAEDCTEAEFYICGKCLHEAVRQFTSAALRRQALEALEWLYIESKVTPTALDALLGAEKSITAIKEALK